jgi:membrane-bound lytic murein transglycosylase B
VIDCRHTAVRGRHRGMLTRRTLAATIPVLLASPAWAADSFQAFLSGVRAEAQRSGIAPSTLDRALAGLQPNQKVLDHFNHQPEFTLSWAQYRALLVTDQRAANGRAALRQNATVMQAVEDRYGVGTGVVVGIWGLESSFGQKTGDYNVVEALATLAWQTKRAAFFRSELLAALHILDSGDITAGRMTGSYAGAMGQPQFMPTSYLRYAVDFEGNGRRDIWGSKADTLASIANYLAKAGWRSGQGWGEQVTVPPSFDPGIAGRDNRRAVADWTRMGVRRLDGAAFRNPELQAAVLLPDGVAGEAFLAYPNFAAIRRYNPSDYYAIAVGLIGDSVTA